MFNKGVLSSAKLRSNQYISHVLVIYLVLLTPDFEKFVIHKKGRKENKNTESARISLEEHND